MKPAQKKSKKLLTIFIVIIAILILCIGSYKLMNSRTFQLVGNLIYRVDTEEKVVFLTFDDGPSSSNTELILDTLDELGIKATFFLIGSEIRANREQALEIVARGHGVGNHTYSHQRMIFKTPSFIRHEIDTTNNLIRELGYTNEILFRPPFGKRLLLLPLYLNEISQTTVMWDIEPETDTSAMSKVQNGSIILLHPMYDHTNQSIELIRTIVMDLQAQGFSFGLLSER